MDLSQTSMKQNFLKRNRGKKQTVREAAAPQTVQSKKKTGGRTERWGGEERNKTLACSNYGMPPESSRKDKDGSRPLRAIDSILLLWFLKCGTASLTGAKGSKRGGGLGNELMLGKTEFLIKRPRKAGHKAKPP